MDDGERVARGDSVKTTTARREVGTMVGDPKAPEGYGVVREGEARRAAARRHGRCLL